MESALISAAAACLSVLAIAAMAGVGLRVSSSVRRRLASHECGYATAARGTPPQQARRAPRGWWPARRQLYRWKWRAYRLARQRQMADRYTSAIGQLGSEDMDARIRGIYALGRSAPRPGGDHPAVTKVLAEFIRTQSRKQWPVPRQGDGPTAQRTTRPDVQAALTVVGLWSTSDDRERIDLTLANLPRARLSGADLTNAKLTGADLAATDLTGADLTGADLISTNLSCATLTRADLTQARIVGADLTEANLGAIRLGGADLRRADLTRANLAGAGLTNAKLTGANLTEANLSGANLTRADLSGAHLTGADLTGAQWPMGSPVPEGWARDPGSGRLTPAGVAAGDSGS